MRLWSLHPCYLDWKGLGADWREGLLGQAIILGRTKGWKNHPQMDRFKAHGDPVAAISYYLQEIHREATRRGYNYNYAKILNPVEEIEPLELTTGQLRYELALLSERLKRRDPEWLKKIQKEHQDDPPRPHPLFRAVEGDVEPWEKGYWNAQSLSRDSS
jgi:hypothetical protein